MATQDTVAGANRCLVSGQGAPQREYALIGILGPQIRIWLCCQGVLRFDNVGNNRKYYPYSDIKKAYAVENCVIINDDTIKLAECTDADALRVVSLLMKVKSDSQQYKLDDLSELIDRLNEKESTRKEEQREQAEQEKAADPVGYYGKKVVTTARTGAYIIQQLIYFAVGLAIIVGVYLCVVKPFVQGFKMGVTGGSDSGETSTSESNVNNVEAPSTQQLADAEGTSEEPKKTVSKYESFKDASTWNENYLFYYLDTCSFDIHDYTSELETLQKNRATMDQTYYNLTKSSSFWGNDFYELIDADNNTAEYIYQGQLSDNKPNGFGAIYRVTHYGDPNQTENVYFQIVYIGKFKDGRFNGFGVEYDTSYDAETIYYMELPQPAEQDDPQQYVDDHYNSISYIGYFENGLYQGNGNQFSYPSRLSLVPGLAESVGSEMNLVDNRMIGVVSGTFKKGVGNGAFKFYSNGYLLYDGKVKNDLPNGKGTTYFANSNSIEYQGELTDGKYNGEGTLYDQNGNVVYSGIWKNGTSAAAAQIKPIVQGEDVSSKVDTNSNEIGHTPSTDAVTSSGMALSTVTKGASLWEPQYGFTVYLPDEYSLEEYGTWYHSNLAGSDAQFMIATDSRNLSSVSTSVEATILNSDSFEEPELAQTNEDNFIYSGYATVNGGTNYIYYYQGRLLGDSVVVVAFIYPETLRERYDAQVELVAVSLQELPTTKVALAELAYWPDYSANTVETWYTTADCGLILRAGPGKEYPKIWSIPYSSAISIQGSASGIKDWSFVSYGELCGWVSNEYLASTPQ